MAAERTHAPESFFALVLALKCYQEMARLPGPGEVPEVVVDHVRRCLELGPGVEPDHGAGRTAAWHRRQIRVRQGAVYDQRRARAVAAAAIEEAARIKTDPPDLINIALERLIEASRELPGFTTLGEMAARIRAEVNAHPGHPVRVRPDAAHPQLLRPHLLPRLRARALPPRAGGLYGEAGRNTIDWRLIERHWRDLMQVALSISAGRLPSATLMRRLRSNSRKNRVYKVFREVGRSVRTVALLRYLADPALRVRVTAATNKVESYNGFAQWLVFGDNGVLADNDPAEQGKLIKLNTLPANLVVFHNALDIADVVRGLVAEGWTITPADLGAPSPYLRAQFTRFGAYATDELGVTPEAFNPVLAGVDFDGDLAA